MIASFVSSLGQEGAWQTTEHPTSTGGRSMRQLHLFDDSYQVYMELPPERDCFGNYEREVVRTTHPSEDEGEKITVMIN